MEPQVSTVGVRDVTGGGKKTKLKAGPTSVTQTKHKTDLTALVLALRGKHRVSNTGGSQASFAGLQVEARS